MPTASVRGGFDQEVKIKPRIEQKDLRKYLRLKKQLAELHGSLHESLKAGATVEEGKHKARRDTGSDKKPNWRAALLEECGEAVVKAVRDATPSKPYDRLRVE